MKRLFFALTLTVVAFWQSSPCMAANVQPVFTNDTVANTLSFNDTFGHNVSVGTYNPATGLWTATGIAGGFTNLTVSGNATVAGTTGLTGLTTVGAITVNGVLSGSGVSTYLASPPTIGGTLPAPAFFTNLSATGMLSGAGFNSLLSAPPVGIGSVTPNGVAATTLSASGAVSGTGFANYLLSPPSIGNTLPNAGKFTTLTATGAGSFNTTLTATGLTTLNGAVNISGSSGTQATIFATNTGTAAAFGTPAYLFTESEGYASFGSGNTHFGWVLQATKNAAGSTTTGSRLAWTGQQLGVGGDVLSFFTAGFQLTDPCLAPVVCNAFNLSGNFTANNPYIYVPAGMTPQTVVGEEIDATLLSTGATEREGLRIVDLGGTQQGTIDAAINLAANGVGWKTYLYAGDNTATFGLAPGGEFLNTPATTVALTSFFNFTNITGVPTLGGIVFGANAGQTICWGVTNACLGGQIRSLTTTAGMSISFGASYVVFQPQGGATALYIQPTNFLMPVLTIATLPTCNAGAEGSIAYVKDTVSLNAQAFNAIIAGAGANTIHTEAVCNGTNWVMGS